MERKVLKETSLKALWTAKKKREGHKEETKSSKDDAARLCGEKFGLGIDEW